MRFLRFKLSTLLIVVAMIAALLADFVAPGVQQRRIVVELQKLDVDVVLARGSSGIAGAAFVRDFNTV